MGLWALQDIGYSRRYDDDKPLQLRSRETLENTDVQIFAVAVRRRHCSGFCAEITALEQDRNCQTLQKRPHKNQKDIIRKLTWDSKHAYWCCECPFVHPRGKAQPVPLSSRVLS